MKRNELVEQIAILFSEYIDQNTSSTPKKMVDFIVDECERLGMEPPTIKRKVTLEERVDPNHIYSYVEYVNEWETEDETK